MDVNRDEKPDLLVADASTSDSDPCETRGFLHLCLGNWHRTFQSVVTRFDGVSSTG